jgi:large subunit ribosomal protein L5
MKLENPKQENEIRKIKIDKVVLNIGGTGEKLDRGFKLLEILTGKKPIKIKATKRIPAWAVRPGMEVGTKTTLRGSEAEKIIKKLLPAINNTLKEKQIRKNFFSFGIHEYIEIPDIEYIREVGIMGLEVTVVFARAGKRVERKKTKQGKAKRLSISPEEIEEFIKTKFKTTILRKEQK